MQSADATTPRVLIIYYSFSAQTSSLVHRLGAGLESRGITLVWEKLTPIEPRKFPIGSVPATIWLMLATLLRRRVPVQPISPLCREKYALIVLAGPTWSYNPSGPVLSFLDRDGKEILAGRQVLALISCRGYWRMHWLGLRRQLERFGARVVNRLVFTHPVEEPWRTMGVFLKLAGRVPEKSRWLRRHYHRYGHSREQLDQAFACGQTVGEALSRGVPVKDLSLPYQL